MANDRRKMCHLLPTLFTLFVILSGPLRSSTDAFTTVPNTYSAAKHVSKYNSLRLSNKVFSSSVSGVRLNMHTGTNDARGYYSERYVTFWFSVGFEYLRQHKHPILNHDYLLYSWASQSNVATMHVSSFYCIMS